jgi:D-arabinose 1-dehydrogenase-like Zn-dependent alcohol dehydrogenase
VSRSMANLIVAVVFAAFIVMQAYERMLKSDVKYRFVIDMASSKK